jgi:CRISPR-associated protein Csm3
MADTKPRIEFIGRVTLRAQLLVKTGLHIGAGKDTIEIGGIDNAVIKHPHSGDPYVPGSSLKGKARFLLEWAFNKIGENGNPFGYNDADANRRTDGDGGDVILRIFGTPAKRETGGDGPTRLIVRDAPLNTDWRKTILDDGLPLTEEKTEVVIDRIAGRALDNVGPRRTERVPAGARFDVEIGYRMWSTDGDEGLRDRECLAWFIQALGLIEQDALGGSGSRGYGQVVFQDLKLTGFDGVPHPLDNAFRAAHFDPKAPPAQILSIVEDACRPARAAA